jgi:hypothetical protein
MSKVLSFKKKDKETNFKVFGRSIAEGDLECATRTLRDLLNCDLERAQMITNNFNDKFKESPNIMMKTMAIRGLIESNELNSALSAIYEVFGVSGPESLMILEAMKRQL